VITVSLHDETGRITGLMTCKDEMTASLNGQWVYGHHDPNLYYVEAEEVITRPALDVPTAKELAVDEEWTIANVPEGATVLIDDAEAGVTDGSDLTLSFPEDRVWRVRIEPPFPWQPADVKVSVT